MVLEEVLGKAWRIGFSCAAVLKPRGVKRLGDTPRSPDRNLRSAVCLDPTQQLVLLLEELVLDLLGLLDVHPHTPRAHLEDHSEYLCLQLEHRCKVLFEQQTFQMFPKSQGERGVLFSVSTDEVCRQFVHLGLGVQPAGDCGIAQGPLILNLVEIVLTEVVQGIAEPILIKQWSRNHRIDNAPFDLDTLGPQPTHIVHCIMKYIRPVRVRAEITHPHHTDTGIQVFTIGVTDGEVPLLVFHCDGYANDVPVLCWPPTALAL